tara:strand:+ start:283 stop:618 length:336 start_codon:yes stop_codon:yes gene_type:complete
MTIKKNINKKGGKIYVELSAANYYSAPKGSRERIRLEEAGIREVASQMGYNCGEAISVQVLDNKLDSTSSISVFADPAHVEMPKKQTQQRNNNNRKRPSNQKKSKNKLDNS